MLWGLVILCGKPSSLTATGIWTQENIQSCYYWDLNPEKLPVVSLLFELRKISNLATTRIWTQESIHFCHYCNFNPGNYPVLLPPGFQLRKTSSHEHLVMLPLVFEPGKTSSSHLNLNLGKYSVLLPLGFKPMKTSCLGACFTRIWAQENIVLLPLRCELRKTLGFEPTKTVLLLLGF